MLHVGLVVKLEAKDGMDRELEELLVTSLPLAVAEPGTVIWMAVRTGPRTFWIFDAHPSDTERQAHLQGRIAARIMSEAGRLLAVPPEITPSTVVATKPFGQGQ